MKLETAVIITKGLCYVTIGGLTPLSAALAQWANTGEWPPRIIWVVVLSGCIVGGATQLLSFLSGSFSNYKQSRTGDDDAILRRAPRKFNFPAEDAPPVNPPLTPPPAGSTPAPIAATPTPAN